MVRHLTSRKNLSRISDFTKNGESDGEHSVIRESWLDKKLDEIDEQAEDYKESTRDKDSVLTIEEDLRLIFDELVLFATTVKNAAIAYKKEAQDNLYDNHPIIQDIVQSIQLKLNYLPPSGAMAGIYTRVDNERGVWKAPANESINSVAGPSKEIISSVQEQLNIDVVAGKSINAIMFFEGKGTLVWGARTLAGNDNKWQYISVCRFVAMVKQSVKNAIEPFVFEVNDANTWVKIQGMLENYLITLWRAGALQGEKPEHAFYVALGPGKTMTEQDIMEGRLIVEIGMAVVRPAEFISVSFSQKMAES